MMRRQQISEVSSVCPNLKTRYQLSKKAETQMKALIEIAGKLGLELHEETESRRASRLYEQLKKEKNVLVVLDVIWRHLDFIDCWNSFW